MSWIIVAFFCACAATISYNTPTIGIGCRSFSFMLYGSLAAIVALLMMLRDWAAQTYRPKTQRVRFLKSIYVFLVALNAFVLVFSTIAQLVGLFRSCFCQHFGPLSSVLELSTGNAQSIDNARKTWIPVGFVAYTGVCLPVESRSIFGLTSPLISRTFWATKGCSGLRESPEQGNQHY